MKHLSTGKLILAAFVAFAVALGSKYLAAVNSAHVTNHRAATQQAQTNGTLVTGSGFSGQFND